VRILWYNGEQGNGNNLEVDMKIVLAKEMGLCHGVRRALEMVEESAGRGQVLRTLGDIVHNPQAVERLRSLGIEVASNLEEVGPGQLAVVTAHGAPPEVFDRAEERNIPVLDVTCPLVRRVQRLAQEMAETGYGVIICGDPKHAEVRGILGYAGAKAVAGRTLEEVAECAVARGVGVPWDDHSRLAILFQTTQREQVYQTFVTSLARQVMAHIRELCIFNTVCAAVARREPAAQRLAGEVDVVIVVGGQHSANTRHLAETCTAAGVATYHIERAEELRPEWFEDRRRVGVTAGTSTPDQAVAAVVDRLRFFGGS
jgi:4-hydroxy-3-methylbut-2-enyl diphosphate reductase